MITMCNTISMPDGSYIESFEGDDCCCLCQKSQAEILSYIANELEKKGVYLHMGEKLVINYSCMGYEVSIEKGEV